MSLPLRQTIGVIVMLVLLGATAAWVAAGRPLPLPELRAEHAPPVTLAPRQPPPWVVSLQRKLDGGRGRALGSWRYACAAQGCVARKAGEPVLIAAGANAKQRLVSEIRRRGRR